MMTDAVSQRAPVRLGRPTPERLIEAVSRLLAERDEREISLRDITRAAGANVAAVNYHFGSKDALIHATLERAVRQQAQAQVAALDALAQAEAVLDLEQIIHAWLSPTLGADPAGSSPLIARVAARVLSGEYPALVAVATTAYAQANQRLLELLAAQLPQISADELAFRLRLMATLAASLLASRVTRSPAPGGTPLTATNAAAARTVRFLVGALQAPATATDVC